MSSYQDVIIETYTNTNGKSSKSIRARPIKGQKFDTSMNVECSSKMRKKYPLGTKFLLKSKLTDREGGSQFLYSHYNSVYEIVSDEEAQKLLGFGV